MTDWNDPNSMVSAHFSVRECTWLPSWGVCHIPTDAEKANLTRMAQKMDQVRAIVGKPIKVHVWIRPLAAHCPINPHDGENYNALVGGATHSAHTLGLAVDFDCGEDCDATRETLAPLLEQLGVRMEKNPRGSWVHLDLMPPNPNRYFIP
jgi:hypothetical protein